MTYSLSMTAEAGEPAAWVVLSEPGGALAEAAAAVEAEIERAGPGRREAVIGSWKELAASAGKPRLIVAVGSQALGLAMENDNGVPVLAVLVPGAVYERFVEKGNKAGTQLSAVLLDQPPSRQLAALRLALPNRQRIGILFGPASRREEAAFQSAATGEGVQLVGGYVDAPGNLGYTLQRTLEDSEVLLAVADPAVFNNRTVQNILATAYRRRVPLVGFSPAYVKAGALLAIYSTPAQMGLEAGGIARAFLSGRPLPPARGPRDFTIGINGGVAHSLGLPLRAEDGENLVKQLRAEKSKP